MARKKYVELEDFNKKISEILNEIENIKKEISKKNIETIIDFDKLKKELTKEIKKDLFKNVNVDENLKKIKFKGKKIKVYDKNRDIYFEIVAGNELKFMPNLIYYIPHSFEDTTNIKLLDDFENKLEVIGISEKFIKLSSRAKTINIKDGTKIFA